MPITKQTIAFVGTAGDMGSSLARGVAHGNYRVLLFDRPSDDIESIAKDIRCNTPTADIAMLNCAHECSWEADIIILDVPANEINEILPDIRDVATQKIVVQLSNSPKQKKEMTTDIMKKIYRELSHSNIIQLWATKSSDETHNSKVSDTLFISGDDNEALQTVSEIIETAGFHPLVKDDITKEI